MIISEDKYSKVESLLDDNLTIDEKFNIVKDVLFGEDEDIPSFKGRIYTMWDVSELIERNK